MYTSPSYVIKDTFEFREIRKESIAWHLEKKFLPCNVIPERERNNHEALVHSRGVFVVLYFLCKNEHLNLFTFWHVSFNSMKILPDIQLTKLKERCSTSDFFLSLPINTHLCLEEKYHWTSTKKGIFFPYQTLVFHNVLVAVFMRYGHDSET